MSLPSIVPPPANETRHARSSAAHVVPDGGGVASHGAAPAAPRDLVPLAAGVLILVLGFLPLVNWIAGGYNDPLVGVQFDEMLSGTAIALGGGVVLAVLARSLRLLSGLPGALARLLARAHRQGPRFIAALSLATFALYCTVAWRVFNARPLLIDEIVQGIQARIFAGGRLWLPTPAHPEFFSILHMVDAGGRVYSQFPPGGPAMMVLGELLGASWLIGPACGAISVALFAILVRRVEARPAVAVAAAVLFAAAPFALFMSSSHMNHGMTLMWLLVGANGLSLSVVTSRPRPWAAFAGGIGFGVAATIRPVDALAFALPAGLWLLARALRERPRWIDALAAGGGVALPMLALMWVNYRTTGAPLLFGYQVLWGKSVDLGFHQPPWGLYHTPARGLELVNLYFLRLQRYLFESPLPSLVPVAGALLLARRASAFDRYLLASGALIVLLYLAYWHDGFFLGPRFFFALLPILVLWAARFPALLGERIGHGLPYRVAVFSLVVAAVVALGYSIPLRANQYTRNFVSERWNADAAARQAGVRDALVLVRESWESQLIVRMWALGVSHPDGERLYRFVDACRLDEALARLEHDGVRGDSAGASLRSLLVDSARVQTREIAPGVNLSVQAGYPYSPRCLRRAVESQRGVMPLAPLLLARAGNNVYARDLQERDTVLLREYSDRPLYGLAPASPDARATPRFYVISRDSLRAAWTADR